MRTFVADPVMARARERVAAAFGGAGRRRCTRVLFVIHEGGGGTPVGNFELMHALAGRYDCLLLTCDRRARAAGSHRRPASACRSSAGSSTRPTRVLDFTREDYRAIVERVLVEQAIDLVHVRHLFKHTFDVPVVAARLGIPVVFSFHDFYFTCPTVHLLDNAGPLLRGALHAGRRRLPRPRRPASTACRTSSTRSCISGARR